MSLVRPCQGPQPRQDKACWRQHNPYHSYGSRITRPAMHSGSRYGWLKGQRDGVLGEGQQSATGNFDLGGERGGKQKEKGIRGYEVGTCWNVQRVSEKHRLQYNGHYKRWIGIFVVRKRYMLLTDISHWPILSCQADIPNPHYPHSLNAFYVSSYQS